MSAHATGRSESYDRIAHLYDVDMARSMPFDDVGLYLSVARGCGGPVLEAGCGNGRVLLEMAQAGIDAVGIDRSAGMLRELRAKARARGLHASVAQMDVRALALRRRYALVLWPYSLITYLLTDDEALRACAEARRVLLPDGLLLVDAFVPRAGLADGTWRQDYRRAWNGGTLVRSKRITAVAGGVNRIERRYEREDADGRVLDVVETIEEIRPRDPAALAAVLARAGFAVERVWWDYGFGATAQEAQFATFAVRRE
jgi:SAM-dependent methyltransferase